MSLSKLIAKISALPEDRRAEVERVVDTIVRTGQPETGCPSEIDLKRDVSQQHDPKRRNLWGRMKDGIRMHDDFDEPLEDFAEYS